jgi:hypothetical protein
MLFLLMAFAGITAAATARAQGAIPLEDWNQFLSAVAPIVQGRLPDYVVTPDFGMLSFKVVDQLGIEWGHLGIRMPYDFCKERPDNCEQNIDRWARDAAKEIRERARAPEPETLRLIVGERSAFLAEAPRAPTAPPPLIRSCAGGLTCALVALPPQCPWPRYLDAHDLLAMRLTEDEAFELAAANTHRHLKPLADLPMPTRDQPIRFVDYTSFESSRLIFVADWAARAAALDGNLWVAAPAANLVVYARDGDAQALDRLSTFVRNAYPSADRPLSKAIYRWTGDGWIEVPSQH